MAIDAARVQQRLKDAGTYTGDIDGQFGPKSWAALLAAVGRRDLGDRGLAMGKACGAALKSAAIESPRRIAHFLAQTATETGGFRSLTENLRYSAAGLMATWPSRFPSLASTDGYANNPQALANKVYGGRLGNGPVTSGDGWRYRGRGLIQLTGKENYAKRGAETGLPLVTDPDLAADPATAVKLACLYWKAKGINALADADDIERVRRAVNGGLIGIADARTYLQRAKAVLS